MPLIPGGPMPDPARMQQMMQELQQGGGQPQAPPEDAPLDPLEHLRAAIEHAQAALVAEPDDADSEGLAKVVQGLYRILAQRQKESDGALGNPALMRTLRRSG